MERASESHSAESNFVDHEVRVAGLSAFEDLKRDVHNVLYFASPNLTEKERQFLFSPLADLDVEHFIKVKSETPPVRQAASRNEQRMAFRKLMERLVLEEVQSRNGNERIVSDTELTNFIASVTHTYKKEHS